MSEVREGYKMTELGVVPSEWEVKRIEEVFDNYGGTSLEKEFSESGKYKVISIGSYGSGSRYIDQGIRVNGQGKSLEKILNKDDLVMVLNDKTLQGNIIGRTLLIDSDDEYVYNQRSERLVPKFGFSKYYWYFLNSNLFRSKVIGIAQGGTQIYVNFPQVKLLNILVPSLLEQQKIASILSTVDEQINETEQLIIKTKELKKGLMQQLLTKGIGHTEFKQTELGEIPLEWEVKTLDEISTITRLAGAEYTDYWKTDETGEIITLRGFNIGPNKLKLHDVEKISTELSMKLIRSKLFKGDIVFPCVGTLGNAAVITENNKYHINQNIAKISPIDIIDSLYLTYYLMSEHTKNEIKKYNTSSSQPNVLVGNLRKFTVNVPTDLKEQQKIAQILSTVDEQIDVYEQEKAKYEELKKGLMQQLLTGQIRVKI